MLWLSRQSFEERNPKVPPRGKEEGHQRWLEGLAKRWMKGKKDHVGEQDRNNHTPRQTQQGLQALLVGHAVHVFTSHASLGEDLASTCTMEIKHEIFLQH